MGRAMEDPGQFSRAARMLVLAGMFVIVIAGLKAAAGLLTPLLLAIFLSVLAVVLESVTEVRESYGPLLRAAAWFFTILFTIEYLVRLISVRKPFRYATSFLGIVDLLSIVPTYLSLFVAGTQSLLVIRSLRLLRVFRVLKVARFLREVTALTVAIRNSRVKIVVFLMVVLTIVLIMGASMYVIEGEAGGFTSIPRGMYWAIVTVTTVGYGDIAPSSVSCRSSLPSTFMVITSAVAPSSENRRQQMRRRSGEKNGPPS